MKTKQVLATIQRTGGITYHVESDTQLVSGYAVSPYPHAEVVISGRAITEADLDRYAVTWRDLLYQPNHCLGVWVDTVTDATYIDVSIIAADMTTARAIAVEHHQLAFFHLDTMTTYSTR